METEASGADKAKTTGNRFIIVSSMLAIYSLCIMIACVGVVLALGVERQTAIANATSTAYVIATQQAQSTTTAIAHLAEQDKYQYIERFDKMTSNWFVGDNKDEYGNINVSIKDGVYIWKINDAKGYIQGTDFHQKPPAVKDYDIYVDLKFVKLPSSGTACAGLVFRESVSISNNDGYDFIVCDDTHFAVEYYEKGEWQTITNSFKFAGTIHPTDWNRIEVNAIGTHITFTINNVQVFELIDKHPAMGGLGLHIDVPDNDLTEIWFDNFGYQSH